MPKSTLIADTTLQERIEIVRKWIPADEGLDGCDIVPKTGDELYLFDIRKLQVQVRHPAVEK